MLLLEAPSGRTDVLARVGEMGMPMFSISGEPQVARPSGAQPATEGFTPPMPEQPSAPDFESAGEPSAESRMQRIRGGIGATVERVKAIDPTPIKASVRAAGAVVGQLHDELRQTAEDGETVPTPSRARAALHAGRLTIGATMVYKDARNRYRADKQNPDFSDLDGIDHLAAGISGVSRYRADKAA